MMYQNPYWIDYPLHSAWRSQIPVLSTGWQCPVCKTIHAPAIPACPNCGPHDNSVTLPPNDRVGENCTLAFCKGVYEAFPECEQVARCSQCEYMVRRYDK